MELGPTCRPLQGRDEPEFTADIILQASGPCGRECGRDFKEYIGMWYSVVDDLMSAGLSRNELDNTEPMIDGLILDSDDLIDDHIYT